MKLHQYFQQE